MKIRYTALRQGYKDLGLASGTSDAALHVAKRLAALANAKDPAGNYRYHGVGTYAGYQNEPRNAAVVEGNWYPGARIAALKTAVTELAQQNRGVSK